MALAIGKYIKFALSAQNSPDLNEVVMGRVSPVVGPEIEEAKTPYIWYRSDNMKEQNTKDGIYGDTATVSIEIVASTYDGLLDVLDLVRKAMNTALVEWNSLSATPFDVVDQTMTAGPEEYSDEDANYSRVLTYTIETES